MKQNFLDSNGLKKLLELLKGYVEDKTLGNISENLMGAPNGITPLDENGKVSSQYLPSYVDDVIECDNFDIFPEIGESGKIYVSLDTNLIYRWTGSAYVEISKSVDLGETSTMAYPGDKGKENADAILKLREDINIILNGDTDAIDKWEEIESFLQGITDTETLTGLLKDIKEEIEESTTENFVTKTDAEKKYQPKGDYVLTDDLLDYATKEDIEEQIQDALFDNIYVDLGLPSGTLWASYNLGANSPGEVGLYFQWGDTEGYVDASNKTFNANNYKFTSNPTKYNGTDKITNLEAIDDAASVILGNQWRIPSTDDFKELYNGNVSKEYIDNYNGSGIPGTLITSNSNGNSIFLPCVGYYKNTEIDQETASNGFYWCNSVASVMKSFADCVKISTDQYQITTSTRAYGLLIRPIINKEIKKEDLDLKPIEKYITKDESVGRFQPKGNYLIEKQAEEIYLSKTEGADKYQLKGNYVTKDTLNDYATKKYVDDKFFVIDSDGYEYVDLGLEDGTLWATCNIGASRPEELGLYFQWGDTYGYKDASSKTFDVKNYKFMPDGSSTNISKYNATDGLTVLGESDDAATVRLGNKWQMPIPDNFTKLCASTSKRFIENYRGSGVSGVLFTSNINGNQIFFPLAGYYNGTENKETQNGYYWSNTVYSGYKSMGHCMLITVNDQMPAYTNTRYYGLFIRPVLKKQYNPILVDKYITEVAVDNKLKKLENAIFDNSTGEFGEVVLVNNKTLEKIAVKVDELENYVGTHTPIGIVVIPTSHDVYGTSEAGVLALVNASTTTPDVGDINNANEYIYDGRGLKHTPTYNGVASIGTGDEWSPVSIVDYYNCYLPSDQKEFNQIVNPADDADRGVLGYSHPNDKHAPSPYTRNGSFNKDYSYPISGNYENALSDFNGKSNTENLINQVTGQPDWKTDSSINNSRSVVLASKESPLAPNACSCWRFHTIGTNQGDWYLPACGEVGYLCVRYVKINNIIDTIKYVFGITTNPLSDHYQSSTYRYSDYYNFYIDFNYHYWGQIALNYDTAPVRPFTRMKLSANNSSNRLDNYISKFQNRITELEEYIKSVESRLLNLSEKVGQDI